MKFPADQFIAALKFVSHAAGVREARYFLNGVCFELWSDSLVMVATDGHRMAHVRLTTAGGPLDMETFTLSNDSVKHIVSLKPTKGSEIEFNDSCVELNGISINHFKIDGPFPQWRRVLPDPNKPHASEEAFIDMKYVQQAMQAGQHIANKKIRASGIKMVGPNDNGGYSEMSFKVVVNPDFDRIIENGVKIMGIRT